MNMRQSDEYNNMVFVVTHATKYKVYIDLAGRFRVLLRDRKRYIFICYGKYSNNTLATQLKNSFNAAMRAGCNKIIKILIKGGF